MTQTEEIRAVIAKAIGAPSRSPELVGVTAREYQQYEASRGNLLTITRARDALYGAVAKGLLRIEKRPRPRRDGVWRAESVFLPVAKKG